jgi:hypothetical protein
MALAGLWETWRSPAGEKMRSFAIVTAAVNALKFGNTDSHRRGRSIRTAVADSRSYLRGQRYSGVCDLSGYKKHFSRVSVLFSHDRTLS